MASPWPTEKSMSMPRVLFGRPFPINTLGSPAELSGRSAGTIGRLGSAEKAASVQSSSVTSPGMASLGSTPWSVVARRQWWIVALCVVLATGASLFYVKRHKVTYQATATVVANPGSSANSASTSSAPSGPDPLVQTHDLSIATAAAKAAGTPVGSVGVAFALDANNAALLDVTATAATSAQAAAAANAASAAYISVRSKALNTSAASLDGQLAVIANQIHALQAQGAVTPGSTGGTQSSGSQSTGANLAADEQLAVAIADYQSLFQQQQNLSLESAGIEVYSSATASGATAVGSSHKVIELAVVAGLLAGLGIALLRHRLDDKLRSAAEVEALSSHSLLSRIPLRSDAKASGTIATHPNDDLAEAVRELRTALRFVSVEREIKTILVTSSEPGEGKSFVAANLAAAWAMSGMLTVLVSSDLRAPTAERLLGVEPSRWGISSAIADASSKLGRLRTTKAGSSRSNGLTPEQFDVSALQDLGTSVMAPSQLQGSRYQQTNGHATNGQSSGVQSSRSARSSTLPSDRTPATDLLDLLVWSGVKDLWLCPAGPVPPNPAELLGSSAFEDLVADISAVADVVIMDSPPVLTVTDAMVLTEQADGILFVVAEGRTSRSVAKRALQLLESSPAPVLGLVANMSARNEVSSYYGSDYVAYRHPTDGDTGGGDGRSPTRRLRNSR